MLRTRIVLLTALVCLGLAPLAHATDGTVLVNQATATTGLPGCSPNPDYLIVICKSGSYRLSGNLTASQDGILITADSVTLDLNGFTITSAHFGINSGNSYVEVENGSVQGGAQSIILSGENELVQALRAQNFTNVAIFIGGGLVEDVTLHAAGTPTTSTTYGLISSGRVLISHARIANCTEGVVLESARAEIVDSLVSLTSTGIDVPAGSSLHLKDSTISESSIGIIVFSNAGVVGYGGNVFMGDSTDVLPFGPATSLGDNVCSNGSKC